MIGNMIVSNVNIHKAASVFEYFLTSLLSISASTAKVTRLHGFVTELANAFIKLATY